MIQNYKIRIKAHCKVLLESGDFSIGVIKINVKCEVKLFKGFISPSEKFS